MTLVQYVHVSSHLLRDRLTNVLAVVLVNLEHVQEDGAQLVDVHGTQRPAHPGVGLENLRNLPSHVTGKRNKYKTRQDKTREIGHTHDTMRQHDKMRQETTTRDQTTKTACRLQGARVGVVQQAHHTINHAMPCHT